MALLTSAEMAEPLARAANGVILTEQQARTVASWHMTPAGVDTDLTAFAHSLPFDAGALYARLGGLLTSADVAGDADATAQVEALRAWVLTRVPHIELITVTCTEEEETEWCGSVPDDRRVREVYLVADYADALGEWFYPGDARYPADLTGHEVNESDGGVWLDGEPVDTAVAMLTGKGTWFWAQECDETGAPRDGSPWPVREYRSRYEDPTGPVEIKTAQVWGFTPDDERRIYDQWRAPARPAQA